MGVTGVIKIIKMCDGQIPIPHNARGGYVSQTCTKANNTRLLWEVLDCNPNIIMG